MKLFGDRAEFVAHGGVWLDPTQLQESVSSVYYVSACIYVRVKAY